MDVWSVESTAGSCSRAVVSLAMKRPVRVDERCCRSRRLTHAEVRDCFLLPEFRLRISVWFYAVSSSFLLLPWCFLPVDEDTLVLHGMTRWWPLRARSVSSSCGRALPRGLDRDFRSRGFFRAPRLGCWEQV